MSTTILGSTDSPADALVPRGAGQIAELVGLGRGLLTAEDEFDALSTWLSAALMHALTYRGLSAAVMNSALDHENGLASTWHAELFEVPRVEAQRPLPGPASRHATREEPGGRAPTGSCLRIAPLELAGGRSAPAVRSGGALPRLTSPEARVQPRQPASAATHDREHG